MRCTRWLSVVVAFSLSTPAATQEWSPEARLDAYFDALEKHGLANGSIAISEKGVIRYRRSVGSENPFEGARDPASSSTRYKAGSLTKLFTAILAMQLVEEGRLTLDNKLAEFYPDLPHALEISYRNLLQHRSGLASYTDAADYSSWMAKPQSQARMLERIARGGVLFAPNARVQYSNTNYLLLGYIIEQIHEAPYGKVVEKRIVDKIGLSRTYFDGYDDSGQHESVSYSFGPGLLTQPRTDPSVAGGAGGMWSTPVDLVHLIDALFAGRIVSANSLATMRDISGGSGMGLWPFSAAGQNGIGHAGAIEGYRALVAHFPEQGISIAYATNAPILSTYEIVSESLATVFTRSHEPPAFVTAKLTAKQQEDYAGTWRFAPGQSGTSPFHAFGAVSQPVELVIKPGADAPLLRYRDKELQLVSIGEDEYLLREFGFVLRFHPRRGELTARGADATYYFRRAN
jgi:D-alanyl-D-alanine carboxypeptidase